MLYIEPERDTTFITPKDVADLLNVSVRRINCYHKISSKYYRPDFPPKIILSNQTYLYIRAEIIEFMEKLTIEKQGGK
ncbi:helix-turn-helix transcriptional regulator [Phocoenobacter atlanticus]|uniref:helix-turn-helix transcriptional regulator n=1 Tax=Phocoenobacter atlanticus TaxID=3416742 RepID=UPI00276B9326|nr:hypothetical protein [Pasteurella atlantica]MDP8101470.1 hypothetical protein [Pasteurella atlantica]